jgi:hypothetical protein
MLRSFFRLALLTKGGGLNKDPTVWLDGATPLSKYICKYKKIVNLSGISKLSWTIQRQKIGKLLMAKSDNTFYGFPKFFCRKISKFKGLIRLQYCQLNSNVAESISRK